jgi:eukaryotic-like serine/threonine-protein kinase
MAIVPGTGLDTYEVVGQIGAGGMREVYRAHDTKLARDIAIKVHREGALQRLDELKRAVSAGTK